MARTATGPERTAITGPDHDVYARLSLKNASGTWKNVSTDFGANDFLTSCTLEEDIDANSMILHASLLRDNGLLASLSPLRSDSTLNVNDVPAYAPMLDFARQWKLEVAVIAHGAALVGGDWKEIGAGTYDVININAPSPTIEIVGRDWGASLLDRWIDVVRSYGDDTTPIAMETVIQSMLDDNLGVAAVTLYTPTSPSFVMTRWTQQPMSLMQAINEVAAKAGYVVRYRYDASNVFRLTLYSPNRTAAPGAEVWSLGPSEYIALPVARIDGNGVRNKIIVRYDSSSTNSVQLVTVSNATSITRYGGPLGIARILEVDLSQDTNIRTSARATAFGTAVLSDLDTPAMEQQFEAPGFWIVQLSDYGKFLANGVHYNADQYGGVTHIQHTIENGTMRTTISVRGQPSGRYRTWVADNPIVIGPMGPPVARVTLSTISPRYRNSETVTLAGSLGTNGVGPLQWRTKIGTAGYSAYSTAVLPQEMTIVRSPYYSQEVLLEVLQEADGQTAVASYTVPARTDDGGTVNREDTTRGGLGGTPTRRGRIFVDTLYSDDGVDSLIDPITKGVRPVLKAADGVAGIESGRGAKTKAAAGTGHAAQGLTNEGDVRSGLGGVPSGPSGRIPTEPVYKGDGSGVLVDTSLGRFTVNIKGPSGTYAGDVMETGGGRGYGGFTDATGGLVSTAKDSTARDVRRAYAKVLYTDGDDYDAVVNGTTYAKLLGNRLASGVIKRTGAWDDGDYGVRSQTSDGRTIMSTVSDSTGRESRRALAKPVYTDSDDLDNVANGSTYKKTVGVTSSGKVPYSSLDPAGTGSAPTLSVSTCTASDNGAAPPPYNRLVVTWGSSNMPSGTEYDVSYNNGGSNFDSSTGDTGTSHTFNSVTFNGTPGSGLITIVARYNGITVATVVTKKTYVT